MQVEYATDISFRQRSDLAPLYDGLVRTAVHAVKAENVATFLGRKLDPRFQSELASSPSPSASANSSSCLRSPRRERSCS